MKSLSKMLLTATALTGTTFLAIGCEPEPQPVPPAPHIAPQPPVTYQGQTSELAKLTPKLASEIDSLPGLTDNDHKRILTSVVKDLTQFFKLAAGPNPSPGFVNRLTVLKDAQTTLANPGISLQRMVAVENQVLHVAVLAAGDIAGRELYDDTDLTKLVDAAKAKINATGGIDDVNGSLHDLTAGDAFQTLKPALVQINQDLSDRFAIGAGPVTEVPAVTPVLTPLPEMKPPVEPKATPAAAEMKPVEPAKPADDSAAAVKKEQEVPPVAKPVTTPPAEETTVKKPAPSIDEMQKKMEEMQKKMDEMEKKLDQSSKTPGTDK